MKYLPLKNQPNVSRTRLQSLSPSMQLDGRGYPHITWLEEQEGNNKVNYSFWDGLKWSYKDSVTVYVSGYEIDPSPNALILNEQDSPLIVFSRKLGSGSRLSLASYDTEWQFNELDVDYDVGWVGIVQRRVTSESSSSSSGGSGDSDNYYVVVYDVTNSLFKVYSVLSTWILMGNISESTTSYSSIKITICDAKIGVAFIESNTSIKYNFFDVISENWSFAVFATLAESALYGDIVDMDLEGYSIVGTEVFCIGWLSGNSNWSYAKSARCLSNGTVTPTDLSDYNIETNIADVLVSSTDYIVNGYKRIGVTIDDVSLPHIVCVGVSSKVFSLSAINVWSEDLIDLEAISNGNVFTCLDINYSGGVKISFGADSGDIYYFEPSADTTFPVANPEMILLNQKDYAYRITSFSPQTGVDILDLYDNYYGQVLREARIPLLVSSNRSTP